MHNQFSSSFQTVQLHRETTAGGGSGGIIIIVVVVVVVAVVVVVVVVVVDVDVSSFLSRLSGRDR